MNLKNGGVNESMGSLLVSTDYSVTQSELDPSVPHHESTQPIG